MTVPMNFLSGPQFLGLYCCLLLGFWFWSKWLLSRDASTRLAPYALTATLDLYQLAWLKAGPDAFANFAIFSALALNEIETTKKNTYRLKNPASKMSRQLFDGLSTEKALKLLEVKRNILTNAVETMRAYRDWATQEELLLSSAACRQRRRPVLVAFLLLLSLGVWRLIAAVSIGHHNVGFLTALLIVFIIVGLMLLSNASGPSALSARGRAYLETLQNTYAQLKDVRQTMATATETSSSSDTSFSMVAVAAVLFGAGVLAGTPYSVSASVLSRNNSSSGGCGCSGTTVTGCGSSCGGSCGGGCGGGCGG